MSKNEYKGGKAPASKKHKERLDMLTHDDVYTNPLKLDPQIVKEIEEKGFSYKFINATQFKHNHGFHHAGWRPYKPTVQSQMVEIFGEEADGFVRRGDLILAIKPKTEVERQKAFIKQKALQQAQVSRNKAAELKALARQAGSDMRVLEGYDDED